MWWLFFQIPGFWFHTGSSLLKTWINGHRCGVFQSRKPVVFRAAVWLEPREPGRKIQWSPLDWWNGVEKHQLHAWFGKLKWKGIFLIVYEMCLCHTNSSPSTSSYKRLEIIDPSRNKCWQRIHWIHMTCDDSTPRPHLTPLTQNEPCISRAKVLLCLFARYAGLPHLAGPVNSEQQMISFMRKSQTWNDEFGPPRPLFWMVKWRRNMEKPSIWSRHWLQWTWILIPSITVESPAKKKGSPL